MSAIGKNGDATYVPVLPSFSKFFSETEKASEKAGRVAGKTFADAMEREAERAQKAVDQAAKRQERAANRAADATDRTRVAQIKLNEAMEKTGAKASQIESAKARLAKAQRDETSAVKAAKRATEDHEKAQRNLKTKTDEASSALGKGAGSFDEYGRAAAAARGDLDQFGDSAGGIGSKLAAGLKEVGRGALLGAGAKIGQSLMGGVHTAMTAGFSRLSQIEQAEAMLGGLGHQAETVDGIMDNAMTAVKGTAFGFGDAAAAAASFVGAGVAQGDDLTRVLTLVGDTAAIAGSSFGEMSAIWTKVAGNQKLSTEELNQLLDRGLGLLPQLQEHYGVTAEEARKMITEGKVSFEDFSAVMEDMVGGSAQKMGDTFAGSADNMRAALGRLGAKFQEPFFDAAPAVFQAIGESVDQLGERLEPAIAAFADWFTPVMENIAQNLGPALISAIDTTFNAVSGLFNFFNEAQGWLLPLGAGLGVVAGALALVALQSKIAMAGGMVAWLVKMTKATTAWGIATKIAAGAQKLFNLAMSMSPMGRAITVIAAVAAALTVFFTKTETGRALWETLTEALRSGMERVRAGLASFAEQAQIAWSAVSTGMKMAWETWIKPVFDAFANAAKMLVQVLATVVVAPILIAWNLLAAAFQFAWENRIKPAWDAMAAGATWLYESALKPSWDFITWLIEEAGNRISLAVDGIKLAWEALGIAATALWETYIQPILDLIRVGWEMLANGLLAVQAAIIQPVFDAVVWAVETMRDGVLYAFDLLKTGWVMLGDGLRFVYDMVIAPIWEAFSAGLRNVYDFAVAPIVGFIMDIWQRMGDRLNAVKDWIVGTVFGGLRDGLEMVKGWFRSGVDAIGNIWADIKAKTAKPVQFVVDVVYNKGIRKAWNLVAKFTGLDELAPLQVAELGAYASGGVLPGYTPGRDIYRMVDPRTGTRVDLSGGEGILRPEATAVLGANSIHAINRAARVGGKRGVAKMLGEGAGMAFKKGGIYPNGDTERKADQARRIAAAAQFMQREHGKPYQWGGVGNPSWDCSGLWSGIVHVLNGRPGTSGRLFNTASLMANPGAFGFVRGLSGPITVGVSSDHMAGTLAGTNAESRGGDGVLWGGSAWGSENGYFPNKYTLQAFLGEYLPGAAGGSGVNIGAMVKGLWDSVMDKLPKFQGAGEIAKLPAAMLKKMANAAWQKVKDSIGSFTGAAGTSGSAESWRDMAMWAMRREGFNADDPAQVNAMLAQIQSESGGNAGISQQIVDVNGTGDAAGVGLLQIIPGTFDAYRDPSLPNDRRDPEANMVAALRYYRSRYGDDLTTTWGHGHGYASGGVLPGYTPGRDVHRFYSPTAGPLSLSGGEAIMVPEWTRAVGGPAAVERMNRAARGSRPAGRSGMRAFADGGTFWAPISQRQQSVADNLAADIRRLVRELERDRDGAKFAAGLSDAMKPVVRELQTIANPDTYEGIAARALANKGVEFAGLVGLENTKEVASTLLGVETALLDARDGQAKRTADIAEKEEKLDNLRAELAELQSGRVEMSRDDQKKLEKAEKALADARKEAAEVSGDDAKKAEKASEKVKKAEEKLAEVREDLGEKAEQDAEKRAESIEKLTEDIAKAELDLDNARRASAENLDMPLYAVLPQISQAFSQMASSVTAATPHIVSAVGQALPQAAGVAAAVLPQAAGALSGLAAAAGPAGVSVGVAVAGVLGLVKVGQMVVDLVDKFIARRVEAKKAFANALGDFAASIGDIVEMVEKQREIVSKLRMDMVRQSIAQTESAMDARNAYAALIRTRLEGDKSVAEAQAALQQGVQDELRRSRSHYNDLSLAYDRHRHNELAGQQEILDGRLVVTDELKALQLDVDAAELTRMANVQKAAADAIESAFAHRAANRAALRTAEDLETAAARLAEMTGKTFGMDKAGARLGEEIADLIAENAEIQGRLWSWKNAFSASYNRRVRPHDEAALRRNNERLAELKAMPEYQGFGVSDSDLAKLQNDLGNLYKWGKTEQAAALLKQSVLGDPARTAAAFKLNEDLAKIADDATAKDREEEDLLDEVALDAATRPLRDSAAAAESAANAATNSAAALREEDSLVASRLESLARFERENAVDIMHVSRGGESRIELTFTDKAAYSAAEVDEMLARLGDVEGLELRVKKLEDGDRPGAAALVRSRR